MLDKKKLMLFVLVLAISFVSMLGSAGLTANFIPYGGFNINKNLEKANLLYPEIVRDWFANDEVLDGVSYNIPTFDGKHGSSKYGEAGWHTTQEEMLKFLADLPEERMKMGFVSKIATRDKEGNIEKYFKMPLLVFSKPSLFYPEDLHALGKPIVWLEGQIHGNEYAAGEAMLAVAQKLATGQLDKVLDKVSVVMLPRYNLDGAYKSQRGTDTASPVRINMDQNRDNTSFESPITRIVHSLVNRYKPHVTLDTHEMGYGYTNERLTEDERLGYKDFHLFDLAILTAPLLNVPEPVRDMAENLFEKNVGHDLNARGLNWHWYFYTQNYKWEPAEVFDGEKVVKGERLVKYEIKEGNPDEGITDPSFSIKPAISLLFETPARRYKVNELRRVHAQVVGIESILNTAVQNAEELIKVIAEARKELIELGGNVSNEDKIVLWTGHKIVNHNLELLSFNEDYSDLEITTQNVIAHRTEDMIPLKTVTRPRAYIISGEKEKMDRVAERLSYTGAKIERLRADTTLKVEAYTITGTMNPRDFTFSRGSAFSGLSKVVSTTSKETKIMTFPEDTYIVHMDQTGGTHAALALEPLGNRSYANYWLSRSDEDGGRIGFIPAKEGKEYQVYRYMDNKRLNTYSVMLDLPLVDNTMVTRLYPLTKQEMEQFTVAINKGEEPVLAIDYINKFQVLPETTSFNMLLPRSVEGQFMNTHSWYLFNWDTNGFVKAPESGTGESMTQLLIADQYISEAGNVIVIGGKE